ncbi:MAG: hypothetical protein AAF449_20490 [Myxococcota bacterium]
MNKRELFSFVRDYRPKEQVVHDLNHERTSFREFAEEAVAALCRRGLLDDDWFDALAKERPGREKEIRAVQNLGGSTAQAGRGDGCSVLLVHPPNEIPPEVDEMAAALIQAGFETKHLKQSDRDAVSGLMSRRGRNLGLAVICQRSFFLSLAVMRSLMSIYRESAKFRGRIVVVALPDAPDLLNAMYRLEVVEAWQKQQRELQDAVNRVGPKNARGVVDDLTKISIMLEHIEPALGWLGRCDRLSFQRLGPGGFEPLIEALAQGSASGEASSPDSVAVPPRSEARPNPPPVNTVGDLFAGVIELDRDGQWKAMLKAANGEGHALLSVIGHWRQSVGLFMQRAQRALSRSGPLYPDGPSNRFSYSIVNVPLTRADLVLPESAVEWLDRWVRAMGGDGHYAQVIEAHACQTPLLVTLGPLKVGRLKDAAWDALTEFVTQLLPKMVSGVEHAQPVRVLVGLEFEEQDYARVVSADGWKEAIEEMQGWSYRKLPGLEFPDWLVHVVPYVEDRTRHLSSSERKVLLGRIKSIYAFMTGDEDAVTFQNFSTTMEQHIEDALR